jgi:hypothetical protein
LFPSRCATFGRNPHGHRAHCLFVGLGGDARGRVGDERGLGVGVGFARETGESRGAFHHRLFECLARKQFVDDTQPQRLTRGVQGGAENQFGSTRMRQPALHDLERRPRKRRTDRDFV